MPLIFDFGSQSGWERGTGGTNCLRDVGPHLRASTVGWGEEQAFVSRINQMEKSRGLRSGLLAGQTSLFMNEGIFLWIQGWVILEAWEGADSCCRELFGMLLCQGQQAPLQNVGDVALGVQFNSRGHEKQRGPSGLYDGYPNNDSLRILESGDDFFLCG